MRDDEGADFALAEVISTLTAPLVAEEVEQVISDLKERPECEQCVPNGARSGRFTSCCERGCLDGQGEKWA